VAFYYRNTEESSLNDLLLQDCTVLQAHDDQVDFLSHRDILVHEGKIEALEPTGEISPGQCKELVEARGQLAMPGFINCHAHVPMVIFRGLAEDVNLEDWFNEYMWPLESNLQPEDVYWGMLLGLAEMIEAGVTSVADHYFHMDRAAQAVAEAGTRAALGWAVFGSGGLDGLEATARFAERYQGAANGRITTWLAPHAPYTCDQTFLKETAGWAERLGLGVHIHAAETAEQTQVSLEKHGKTPIQQLEAAGILDHPCIVAHACGATDDDIRILAKHGTGVAHAPKTYLKLAMGTAPILAMRQAGVPVGLASDGAVSNNTLDLFESMRLMAMTQKQQTKSAESMNLGQTLTIATRESATVYGLGDELGHLAPGRDADLILVNTDGLHMQPPHNLAANLVYSARASDVDSVMVAGRWLMRARKLLTLNKAEIVEQVGQSMRRLAQRVPQKRIQLYQP